MREGYQNGATTASLKKFKVLRRNKYDDFKNCLAALIRSTGLPERPAGASEPLAKTGVHAKFRTRPDAAGGLLRGSVQMLFLIQNHTPFPAGTGPHGGDAESAMQRDRYSVRPSAKHRPTAETQSIPIAIWMRASPGQPQGRTRRSVSFRGIVRGEAVHVHSESVPVHVHGKAVRPSCTCTCTTGILSGTPLTFKTHSKTQNTFQVDKHKS